MRKKPVFLPARSSDSQPDHIRYDPIYCEMQRLRHNMIFHSTAYYEYDITFIEDATFDKWGKRLVEMQAQYPDWAKIVPYAEEFKDWDGSTGFHLVGVDEIKFISKIYHHITYMMETRPDEVTEDMKELVDNIRRGLK